MHQIGHFRLPVQIYFFVRSKMLKTKSIPKESEYSTKTDRFWILETFLIMKLQLFWTTRLERSDYIQDIKIKYFM